jgi:hypothetical protein
MAAACREGADWGGRTLAADRVLSAPFSRPSSTYDSSWRLASRSFGHGPQGHECFGMARPAQRSQASDEERKVLEARMRLPEVALKPTRSGATRSSQVVLRDRRGQFERFAEAHMPDLAYSRLGEQEIASLERSPEDRSRVPLRSQL